MSKYTNAQYPSKANDFIDNDGNLSGFASDGVKPLTEAPTSDNTSGKIQFVWLESEPEHRYAGYIYLINDYQIIVNAEGCVVTGEHVITPGTGEVTITVTPEDEYRELPDTISVTNADFEYNKDAGTIRIFNATNNVVIDVNCIIYVVLNRFTSHDYRVEKVILS